MTLTKEQLYDIMFVFKCFKTDDCEYKNRPTHINIYNLLEIGTPQCPNCDDDMELLEGEIQ